MNGKFRLLLICFLFSLLAFGRINVIQQLPSPKIDLKGTWEFVKAEYSERLTLKEPYQVKQVIEKEENLYAFEQHFSNVIKSALFEDEIAIVYDLFSRFCGRYSIISTGNPEDKQVELLIGNADEIGMVYADTHVFNAPNLRYLIDRIDDETIGITLENIIQHDTVTVYGAVRCILKKVS